MVIIVRKRDYTNQLFIYKWIILKIQYSFKLQFLKISQNKPKAICLYNYESRTQYRFYCDKIMQKYIGEIVQCKTVAIIHENEIVEIQLVFEMCQKLI